ncbi:MAG TPA: DUF2332 domain-containing protein [Trebonia sp.]
MSEKAAETEQLRRLFRFFSATQGRGRSPVYELLSEAVVGDDDLLALLLSAPVQQRRPSLLFAAVNLLIVEHPGAELAAYYPIHGGPRSPDSRLAPAFSAFCARHRGELVRLLRDGSTQTNEIRRCVALRLGLEHVRRRWPGSVALVEVGASAGLNLLFDRYRYRLNGHDVPGTSDSKVTISCEVRGQEPGGQLIAQLIGPPPGITSRLGFDQHPVDVAAPAERAWLEAFIWPERTSELATLRAAIDLALSASTLSAGTLSAGAAIVVKGDAVTDTATLLNSLPGSEPVVVFTASLFSYLTADARAAFAAQLRLAAARRPVAWVFAEAPGLLTTVGLNTQALNGPPCRPQLAVPGRGQPARPGLRR